MTDLSSIKEIDYLSMDSIGPTIRLHGIFSNRFPLGHEDLIINVDEEENEEPHYITDGMHSECEEETVEEIPVDPLGEGTLCENVAPMPPISPVNGIILKETNEIIFKEDDDVYGNIETKEIILKEEDDVYNVVKECCVWIEPAPQAFLNEDDSLPIKKSKEESSGIISSENIPEVNSIGECSKFQGSPKSPKFCPREILPDCKPSPRTNEGAKSARKRNKKHKVGFSPKKSRRKIVSINESVIGALNMNGHINIEINSDHSTKSDEEPLYIENQDGVIEIMDSSSPPKGQQHSLQIPECRKSSRIRTSKTLDDFCCNNCTPNDNSNILTSPPRSILKHRPKAFSKQRNKKRTVTFNDSIYSTVIKPIKSDHRIKTVHNNQEKIRRQIMNDCFNKLQQQIPSLCDKHVSKHYILNEAIRYISELIFESEHLLQMKLLFKVKQKKLHSLISKLNRDIITLPR